MATIELSLKFGGSQFDNYRPRVQRNDALRGVIFWLN